MKIDIGTSSKEELASLEAELARQEHNSDLGVLNATGGLRGSEVSVVVSPYGNGKSTFIRTVIVELLKQHRKVFCFLSEEKTSFYKKDIVKYFNNVKKDQEKANIYLQNLFMQSQTSMNRSQKNYDYFITELEKIISTLDIDVLIFDNFTTSFMCRESIGRQAEYVEIFKELAVKYEIVFLLVVHTVKNTDIYKNIITGEDVRGNATTTNIGSYNYVLTTYFRLDVPRSFIVVDKARYHSKANKKVFELNFDHESGLFVSDRESNFKEMQRILSKIRKGGQEVSFDTSDYVTNEPGKKRQRRDGKLPIDERKIFKHE